MTNQEKLKKALTNDFDKEKNYNEIIKKIEKEEKMKIKNNLWKWSLVPICLIIVIGGLLFIKFKNNNHNLTNSNTPYIDKQNNVKLNINNIDKLGATRLDADIKEISTNDINIVWPEILKDGITIPEDLDKYKASAIYTRKDMTSEYDILNCYVYDYYKENDNAYKNIRLAFSDTNKPIRDYRFSDEGSKETIINDVKLKIYKYEDIYFTEFKYQEYNFDIEAQNISEQELSNLLISIIK